MTEILNSPIVEFTSFEIVIVVFCGLVFGSFASALTYRVPRDLPWLTKGKSEHGLRSACPSCKTLLTPKDLIPIFSWLISKGQCRHCEKTISKTYPICEILTLLGCAGIYAVFGLTWHAIPIFLMIPFLVSLMMIDFEHMILPNQLVAIVFILGLCVFGLKIITNQEQDMLIMAFNYMGGAIIFALFAWGLGGLMQKILNKDALGFGDVKFFAAVGVWIGLPMIGMFCMGAGIIGVIMGVTWQKITGEAAFPFGPALILSFYGVLLLQGSHLL
ncbi:MAG: A24 family peptidase [Bdellovibrionales bacterium]